VGLDIWFRDDIANILKAAHQANRLALEVSEGDEGSPGSARAAEVRWAYRRGFAAALATLAMAFGLSRPGGGERRHGRMVSTDDDTEDWGGPPLPTAQIGGAKWER